MFDLSGGMSLPSSYRYSRRRRDCKHPLDFIDNGAAARKEYLVVNGGEARSEDEFPIIWKGWRCNDTSIIIRELN